MPPETSPHWPAHLPRHLTLPATNLYFNAEVSAARYPDKPFIVFYDTPITFAQFKDETERIAGYLQQHCDVKAGDRVLLYMQNSPQWMLAYYGILRANAVVVPVNPMNMTDELRHYVEDGGARTAFVAQNLYERIAPLVGDADGQLAHTIVATYSDYLKQPSSITPPEFVSAPRHISGGDHIGVTHWNDMLDARVAPGPLTAGPDDLCVMPYHVGHDGQAEGLHAHTPQRHVHRARRGQLGERHAELDPAVGTAAVPCDRHAEWAERAAVQRRNRRRAAALGS